MISMVRNIPNYGREAVAYVAAFTLKTFKGRPYPAPGFTKELGLDFSPHKEAGKYGCSI